MKFKPVFAASVCTAAVLLTAPPVQAMGVVDANAAVPAGAPGAGAKQHPTAAPTATATAVATAAEGDTLRDGEVVLVAIAAMALAARSIAVRMR